jgi:putative ABC transport system ATP-binding protein
MTATVAAGQGTILPARRIAKSYRTRVHEVLALRGVDLDVRAGELVMVMGPSGHGKTTLLNCHSGLDDIDAGTVGGYDLFAMSDADRTRHRASRMGFVVQSFNLIPVVQAAGCPGKARVRSDELSRCWRRSRRRSCR